MKEKSRVTHKEDGKEIVAQLDKLRRNVKKDRKDIKYDVSEPKTKYILAGVFIIVIVVLGAIALSNYSPGGNFNPDNNNGSTIQSYTSSCVNHQSLGAHFHVDLTITVNNVPKTIPANIGIVSDSCFRPIHTHDSSGHIHIELPKNSLLPEPRLSDFFAVWGEPLTSTVIWDYSGIITAKVDGFDYSGDLGSIVMVDGKNIDFFVSTT